MNCHAHLDEEFLVQSGLHGDAEALDTLFARYARPLYQTALRLLGNPEDAEDALQDGLLSAVRNLKRFEGRSKFSTWLTRIVINASLMQLRKQRARPTVSLEQEDPEQRELTLGSRIPDARPGPEEAYVRKERVAILDDSLKTLPPALQSALWLRDVEGLSTAEAARELGLSEGTVKSQLHRARNKLLSGVRPSQPLREAVAAA